ncbi:MAG TPA: hypothetical protein VJT73_02715, partial [Polyangiaceae bacterium]|nr:hypothetical protein [Polyangiaceae bacterium]
DSTEAFAIELGDAPGSTALEAPAREIASPLAAAQSRSTHEAAPPHSSHETRAQTPSAGRPPPSEPTAPSGDPGAFAVDPRATEPGSSSKSAGEVVDLHIAEGDWSHWVDPTAPVARAGPGARRSVAPVSTTGGLAEALAVHDQEVGLGPAGAVLSAARDAAHSDVAPAISTANLSVTLLATGEAIVALTGATSHGEAWKQVATHMERALKKRPARIAGEHAGLRIDLEIAAEERWPNGARVKSEGPYLALSGGSIAATDEAKEGLARRNLAALPPPGSPVEKPSQALNVDLPGLWLKGRGKVCEYQVGLTPLGLALTGGCDPSNIGAPPARVVSTRVLRQTLF